MWKVFMSASKLILFATLLLCAIQWAACTEDEMDPQRIVDRAIDAHGGADQLDGAIIQFDFRDRRFTLRHDGGHFRYERTFPDSSVRIHDVLANDGVYREIAGDRIVLSDSMRRSVTSGVNSVAYFALLPFKLNDPAVKKRYLGADSVRQEPYHKVEITFEQERGGRAYEDRFVYWFHRDRHTMDYFAYDFEEDGGGTRFREAVRPRRIDGLLFVDYINYMSDLIPSPGDSIEHYDRALEAGNVRVLSEINLENISVKPISTK
jgi:hypothetical protein